VCDPQRFVNHDWGFSRQLACPTRKSGGACGAPGSRRNERKRQVLSPIFMCRKALGDQPPSPQRRIAALAPIHRRRPGPQDRFAIGSTEKSRAAGFVPEVDRLAEVGEEDEGEISPVDLWTIMICRTTFTPGPARGRAKVGFALEGRPGMKEVIEALAREGDRTWRGAPVRLVEGLRGWDALGPCPGSSSR